MNCSSKEKLEIFLMEHNPPFSLEDIFSFRDKIRSFMHREVENKINEWEVIITINRKGTMVFYDLVNKENIPPNILQLTDYTIHQNSEIIAGKKLLLFDDSVDSGDTIYKIVSELDKVQPKSISIVSLLAESTLKFKFQGATKIEMICWKKTEQLILNYVKYFKHYLDYLCMPQTKDLIVEKVVFPRKLSEKDLMDVLTIKEIKPTIYDYKLKCPDSMLLCHDFLEYDYVLEYIEKSSTASFFKMETKKWKLDQFKIRFFVHFHDSSTEIYLEYILHPLSESVDDCKSNFKYFYATCQNRDTTNSEDCLICFTYNEYKQIRETVIPHLISKGIEKKVEFLPWYINGKIITENSFKN